MFKDLKIGTRLFSLVGLLSLVLLGVGFIGLQGVNQIDNGIQSLYHDHFAPSERISRINDLMRENIQQALLACLHDPRLPVSRVHEANHDVTLHTRKIEANISEITRLWGEYQQVEVSDEGRVLASEFNEDRGKFVKEGLLPAVALLNARKFDQASLHITGTGMTLFTKAKSDAEKVLAGLTTEGHREMEMADETHSSMTIGMITSTLGGIVVAVFVAFWIIRSVTVPLGMAVRVANAIAVGDLTVEIEEVDGKDETAHLLTGMKRMAGNLRDIVSSVTESSSAVASASSEISSSSEQMAAGTQEQSTQSNEVAGAVEEMTKTIVENSQNASTAAQTAREAKSAAEEGGRVVRETIDGMKEIAAVVSKSALTVQELGKSSDQIGEIVTVIDDIADQTNLLALNAAIEAARAGDQGRGFAVVADEVRKLAERTTKATKEIAAMIRKIQTDTRGAVESMEEGTRKLDDGIQLADRAGVSLERIVEISQQVTDMVTQIAAASDEQSSASEQISRNVEAISSVTNQSASATQQIARAAEDLNRLTEGLQSLVGRFTINGAKGPGFSGSSNTSSLHVNARGEITSSSGAFDVESAKRAHVMWRARIHNLLTGKERIDEKEVVSHRDCKLGKWYYSLQGSAMATSQTFDDLGKRHEEMHKAVRHTVALYNKGDAAEARKSAEEVYRLSEVVVGLLDRLDIEIGAGNKVSV